MSTESQKQIEKIVADALVAEKYQYYQPSFYTATTTEEHAALCLNVVKAIRSTAAMQPGLRDFIFLCFAEYLTGQSLESSEEAIRPLRDVAIDGVYEYLDEQIDSRNVIYSVLLKYEQRSEWFYKNRLRTIADEGLEGAKGERGLARDLQEYIFNQHIEFVIEPRSSSGEVDLILREPAGRYLIIDAKYVPVESMRSTIRDQLRVSSSRPLL